MAHLTLLDQCIILASLAIVVTVGLWFARRWRGSEGFFLAGRELAWPFIGFSLFATNISTEHFVGLAAGGHDGGLVYGGYEWIASYCLIMLAAVFAPQYLKHRVFTIPEFFEKRYGIETRVGLSLYFLAMIVLTKVTLSIFAGAGVISEFTGWELGAVMWGIGICTAVYTMAGGLTAVVYTDSIQAVILTGGSVVLTLSALGQVGGWGGLTAQLAASGHSDMLSMVRPPDDPKLPFTGYLLGNFLIGGMFYWCMDQVNVQRVLGARDVHHARSGAIFAGFLKILPVFIMTLPGVIAFVLYPEIGEDHNSTYAVLVKNLLGPGLRGLVLAALIAALMSSLSSSFTSAATLVARDLVARFRPQTGIKAQILFGQAALVLVMVGGILVAGSGVVERYDNLWDYLQEITAYLSVPFAVAGLLGILSRRVNRPGALAGIGVGVLVGAALFTDTHWTGFFAGTAWAQKGPFLTHPYLASFLHRSFLAGVCAAIARVAVSLATAPPPKEVTDGAFYLFRRGAEAEAGAGGRRRTDRFWIAALFLVVTALWWIFR